MTGETWSYTKWGNNEPSNSNNTEDLLQFCGGGATRRPYWNDMTEIPQLGYIVEYNSNPAPEPTTITLLGVGAIGLMVYTWRRRRMSPNGQGKDDRS
jgi:hypothetical protein